jgi:hypothetical protein
MAAQLADMSVVQVEEDRSSMEARARYLHDHPGRGLARLLPLGLRTPDGPYDDYVAEILAARYFETRESAGIKGDTKNKHKR